MEYTFVRKGLTEVRQIEAYMVSAEHHIAPVIGIGDIVIVDTSTRPELEDYVIATNRDGQTVVGRLVKEDSGDTLGIATRSGFFTEYTNAAVILQVNKKLKPF